MNRKAGPTGITEVSFRRVLVALDATRHDPAGLLAAAEHALQIAASTGAELNALFVEDIGLSRLARLPVVCHVNATSGSLQAPPDSATLRRALDRALQRCREQLTLAGERRGLSWRYRVVRGSLARAIATAAVEADLLVVEGSGYRVARHFELHSTTRSAAIATRRSVLLVQRGVAMTGALTVIHERTPGAARALAAALRLSGTSARPVVLVLADTPADEPAQAQEVRAWLEGHGVDPARVRVQTASPVTLEALAQAVGRPGATVVVSGDSPWLGHDRATALFDAIPGHVLIVA